MLKCLAMMLQAVFQIAVGATITIEFFSNVLIVNHLNSQIDHHRMSVLSSLCSYSRFPSSKMAFNDTSASLHLNP